MRRGLTTQSIVAMAVLGAIIVGSFAVMTVAVTALRTADHAEKQSAHAAAEARALEKSLLDIETGLRGFLIAPRTRFLEPYREALATYPGLALDLERRTAGDTDQHAHAEAIKRAMDAYVRDWATPLIALARHDLAAARAKEAGGGGKERVDAARRLFALLAAAQQSDSHARSRHADRLGRLSVSLGVAGVVVSGLLILLLATRVQLAIARPLRRLAESVARLAAGELSVRVQPGGTAEVGDLTRGFNSMAESLELHRSELENQRSELEAQQVELEQTLFTLEERNRQIELLQQFGERLGVASTIEAMGDAVLAAIADAARAEIGALYLAGDDGRFAMAARRGLAAAAVAPDVMPGDGLAGRALAERRPVAVAYGETRMKLPGIVAGRDAAHELHLPLMHGERSIGVVSLGRAHDEPFSQADSALLEDLARRAAVVVAELMSVRRLETVARNLETLLAATDLGIYGLDREGRITLVNRAALDLTGYTREELLGKEAHALLHHSHLDGSTYPAHDCPIQQVIRSGVGCRVDDDVYWQKDGTPFPVEYSAEPLFEDDELAGVVVTFIDIAARKRFEQQREAQFAVTRALAEARSVEEAASGALSAACTHLDFAAGVAWLPSADSPQPVASFAAPGFEDAVAELVALPLAEGDGPGGVAWTTRRVVLSADLDRTPPRKRGSIGGVAAAAVVPIAADDGQQFAFIELYSAEPLVADGLEDTLTAIASRVAQYAERRRAESETQRMRDEFVATVSHELRTPLTAIDGWLGVLLEDGGDPLTEEQHRFLTTVKRNSDRLMRLVGDLLLSGQIESGHLTLELGDVDMVDLTAETVDLVRARADAKSVQVTLDADGPVVVRGDRARLVQLFDNLLANAVKFTPEGGDVRVEVVREGEVCRISVTDTGIGIPAADRDRLFQRFFRASSAAQHGIPGTGLGLSIAKAIAESHGGTIGIADRSGPGTTFVVELPLAIRQQVSA